MKMNVTPLSGTVLTLACVSLSVSPLAAVPPSQDPAARPPAGARSQTTDSPKPAVGEAQKGAGLARASDLIGTKVENARGEKLGVIQDIVFDIHSGRSSYAVISTDGLLKQDKLVAVPLHAFRRKAGSVLILDADKERLESAPAYDHRKSPEVSGKAWGARRERQKGAQEVSSTRSDRGRASDGTARLDAADRNLTGHIRQRIAADPHLRAEAKDVEVQVEEEKVVLTGSVRSEEIKQRIEDLVLRVAGEVRLENQLQVRAE